MTSFLFNGHEPSSFMLTEISRFRAGVFLASLGAMGVVTFAPSASHFAASATVWFANLEPIAFSLISHILSSARNCRIKTKPSVRRPPSFRALKSHRA